MIQACDRCHRRKPRCDKLQPCAPCEKAKVACNYTDRGPPNVEKLERRLRQAEAKNKILTSELAKTKATSASEQSQTTSLTYPESTTPLEIPDGPISRPDTAT